MEKRCSFELFKSNVCHRLKEQGDIDFLIETLKEDMIRQYYDKKWYPESFYLLAMVDYISRENNVPICNDYDDLRQQKMQKMIYPVGILITASVLSDDSVKEDAVKSDLEAAQAELQILKQEVIKSSKNPFGAGRKPKLTVEQVEQVKMLSAEGLSVRKIAAKMDCSAALICKLLKDDHK